jgi:all-trans-retinol 13,14-reductase
MQYDSIIIGSGAGGLATALCLARAGQKVLVLEKHYVPGGWCHSFYLNGQRFSPGVHYIGLLDKGSSTSDLYAAMGIANELIFFRMNPDAFEHCLIGKHRIDMPAGFDRLYESLAMRFPMEKSGLKKYLKLVRQVSCQIQLIPKMSGFWDNVTIPFRTPQLGKYALFPLKKVIDWFIKDPLLKKVLNVQCGDHGVAPGKASFPLHCAVMDHYSEGGFYPMGGGAAIVKATTTAIKSNNGEVRSGIGVSKILLEGDKIKTAVGVELENGEKIYAANIVSNADPSKTYLDLIGADNISRKLKSKLDKTRYSVTSLILFLTVNLNVKSAGLDSGNNWIMKDIDSDELFNAMKTADILKEDEFPAVFVSCTTLKDPVSYNGRYHNLELVTFIDYASFSEFEKQENYHTARYRHYKDRICEKFLNTLEKLLPGARTSIVQMELGTPKTNQFYIGSTNGNVYGTEKDFWQTGPFSFSSKSEIKNLYLCGASILSHGVGGATNSGIQTAAQILKQPFQQLLKPLPGQELRVYDAEDSTHWPRWMKEKIAVKKSRNKIKV